ncbi:chemotaxis protein [Solibacillus merdavium]|uniref:Chemotaxis protein n=1 Tax=Solibacillus merdavium TaxID=2762218 RepID=A0ABR8XI06_9BACL|nr:chemotaxis protein [Solibacillus merdavium]MBD8031568.1 chemotaxis protein [Solibacillus merdavium]
MKKSLTAISAALILSTVLAACNTDTDEPITTSASEEQLENENAQNEVQQEEQQEEKTESTEPIEETQDEQEVNKEEITTLTYSSNSQPFTEEVVEAKSEEMNYSIQHFENYTLVAEEPGVDQLIFSKDDGLSMQIEVVNKEEATFEQMKATAKEAISAIAPDNVKDLDFSTILTERPEILNITGYEGVVDGEKVVKVVLERTNLIATLTIYDTPQADLTDAFLQMGLTIQ